MKRRLFIAAAISTPLIAVALLIIMILRSRAEAARTDELLAQWQAAGGALTLAELKPDPIPDNQNAAVLYEQAFAELGDWTEQQYDAISNLVLNDTSLEVLSNSQQAIDLVIEAGQRPDCQWDSEVYEKGILGDLPHLRQSRRMAKLLRLAAQDAFNKQQWVRSVELLSAMRLLSRHVGTEPALTGALYARAIDILALNQFNTMFAHQQLPENTDALEISIHTKALDQWAIVSEGSLTLGMVVDHYDKRTIRLKYQRDIQYGLESSLYALSMLDDENLAESDFARSTNAADSRLVSALLVPNWRNLIHYLRYPKRLELAARLAIDLRRYRDDHGEYPDPESWDMPIDPLSGKPMIYRRTDAGFEIIGSLDNDENPLEWRWH